MVGPAPAPPRPPPSAFAAMGPAAEEAAAVLPLMLCINLFHARLQDDGNWIQQRRDGPKFYEVTLFEPSKKHTQRHAQTWPSYLAADIAMMARAGLTKMRMAKKKGRLARGRRCAAAG